MEVEISVTGEAVLFTIELIKSIYVCGWSVRNLLLFDLMLGRTRGTVLFESGGGELAGGQCER